MKVDKTKRGRDGRLKNGVIKEYYKDGSLSCAGNYKNGEKVGL